MAEVKKGEDKSYRTKATAARAAKASGLVEGQFEVYTVREKFAGKMEEMYKWRPTEAHAAVKEQMPKGQKPTAPATPKEKTHRVNKKDRTKGDDRMDTLTQSEDLESVRHKEMARTVDEGNFAAAKEMDDLEGHATEDDVARAAGVVAGEEALAEKPASDYFEKLDTAEHVKGATESLIPKIVVDDYQTRKPEPQPVAPPATPMSVEDVVKKVSEEIKSGTLVSSRTTPAGGTPAKLQAPPRPPKAASERSHKSSVDSPTKLVWYIADEMTTKDPSVPRKKVIEECQRRGIAFYTARTQYQQWLTAKRESDRNAAEANNKHGKKK